MKEPLDPEVQAHYRQLANRRMRHTKACSMCGAQMERVAGNRRYCSVACKAKAEREVRNARIRDLESLVLATNTMTEARARTVLREAEKARAAVARQLGLGDRRRPSNR